MSGYTPTEACAYALAMLENERDALDTFMYGEACGVIEEAGVSIIVVQEGNEFQAEVCSPVGCGGRQAFAMVGNGNTQREALVIALQQLFLTDDELREEDTQTSLTRELRLWCASQGLECGSADELLCIGGLRADQLAYLYAFLQRWSSAQ